MESEMVFERKYVRRKVYFWMFAVSLFSLVVASVIRLYLYNLYDYGLTYASEHNVPLSSVIPAWINSNMFYQTWFILPALFFMAIIGGIYYAKYL